MRIYRGGTDAESAVMVRHEDRWYRAREFSFDALFRATDAIAWLTARLEEGGAAPSGALAPPIEGQEVWAAGVTYLRSRTARMEESLREADIYDRVYSAERPELFFKATPHRVVGHGGEIRIRRDSDWNVPEAELALAVNCRGEILGYSIGNDMSSRVLEGENPLYLPQAKIYDGSCALGPCLLLTREPLAAATAISLRVWRDGAVVFEGETQLSAMKRSARELVEWLCRENSFPNGAWLLTGTGIVPAADFTTLPGDEVEIGVAPIGTLRNRVGVRRPHAVE